MFEDLDTCPPPPPLPCTRTPVTYLRCWPDNIHVFECFDTFLPPPPPSPCTWSSVIWWTLSKSNLEAITKSIFINLYFMVNGCPLQVRMHRFTDPPEVHLGDCFRPSNAPIFKTLNSFWKTTLISPALFQLYFNYVGLVMVWLESSAIKRKE